MGKSGTDAAREAADVVLTDDNFVTIVHAVEESRVTFGAVRKTTFFLVSTAVGALVAVTLSVFASTPLLFLPVQILWMNVVTNGAQDIALTFEPAAGDELNHPPRAPSEGILSRTLWFRAGITGCWMALAVILSFIVALHNGYPEIHARSLALTMFVVLTFFRFTVPGLKTGLPSSSDCWSTNHFSSPRWPPRRCTGPSCPGQSRLACWG
ncbi:cation transporting ATPase C-terminal domain-containing protein [Arthrobacter sp. H20]|uniref:cation transporting ATPase C-terminal domain-containing protein n=1 Tax=Arthrobacter sp. H20 TaxID=1267981 RepID=UPI00047BD6E3|nr:cation transporting ATPase C-terminal domain-containing protein [Arthrobacter sp. H20]